MTHRLRGAMVLLLLVAGALSGCTSTDQTSSPGASEPAPSGSPSIAIRSLAVVGDSISVGYNACDRSGPCKEASWATGTDSSVDSVATRLGLSGPEAVHNLAVPATRMRNTSQELSRVSATVDLVLVLSGANDACQPSTASMTDAATFAQRIDELFAVVGQRAPHATVLMLSVPDVTQLAHIDGVPQAVQDERVAAGLCGSVLGTRRHGASDADRAAVRARIAQYDSAIRSACRTRSNCIDDGGALTKYRFGLGQVSDIDSFHPSQEGQRAIADIAWRALVAGQR